MDHSVPGTMVVGFSNISGASRLDTQERWPQLLRHLAREHQTLFGINVRPRPGGETTTRVGDPIRVT